MKKTLITFAVAAAGTYYGYDFGYRISDTEALHMLGIWAASFTGLLVAVRFFIFKREWDQYQEALDEIVEATQASRDIGDEEGFEFGKKLAATLLTEAKEKGFKLTIKL